MANVAQCSSEAKRRRTLRDTQERAIDSCCRYRAQCAFAAQVSALEHNVSPITAVPAWHGKSGSTNYDDDERLSLLPAGLPDPGSWAGSCLRRSRRWTTSSIDEWCTMRASKARPRTSALHVHVLTRVGLILKLAQGGIATIITTTPTTAVSAAVTAAAVVATTAVTTIATAAATTTAAAAALHYRCAAAATVAIVTTATATATAAVIAAVIAAVNAAAASTIITAIITTAATLTAVNTSPHHRRSPRHHRRIRHHRRNRLSLFALCPCCRCYCYEFHSSGLAHARPDGGIAARALLHIDVLVPACSNAAAPHGLLACFVVAVPRGL